MSLFPVWPYCCGLMCQICQMCGTMLKEAFVKEERTGGQLLVPGDSDRTVRFSSFVRLSRLVGPLWRLDRLIPPPESNCPPCLVCMSAFPFSLGGISLSTPSPLSKQMP